ncbi:MAG: MBL fold metallo-hydrolase, partial [Kiritimatiellaeota bacterium]|nr:MBL fold metallo-hydrolase [Kiritimatiellota bacterium]
MKILYDAGHSLSNNLFSGTGKNEIAALAPAGFTPAECRVFHVSNPDEKSCLIDTGRGGAKLREEMKKAEIAPESINAILLTHSHGDHTGGLLLDDGATPVFSNATVFITAPELEFWRK